jgi:hypothetical protein
VARAASPCRFADGIVHDMGDGVHIESQSYRISADEALRSTIRATWKSGRFGFLYLAFFGVGGVVLGYARSDPGFVALGLLLLLFVPAPFFSIWKNHKKSLAIYDHDQKAIISNGEFRRCDDIGNARIKPLSLLSQVKCEGLYVKFHFDDDNDYAVPLDAFTGAQLSQIQELVDSQNAVGKHD